MADWNEPTTTTLYTAVLTALDGRLDELAAMFDGASPTNLPSGAIRWNSGNKRLEKWNGSTWEELDATGMAVLTALQLGGVAAASWTRRDLAQTITGLWEFANIIRLQNNQAVQGRETGGTARVIGRMNASDQVELGSANNSTSVRSSGLILLEGKGRIYSATPILELLKTDASADNGRWDFVLSAGALLGRVVNDAQSVSQAWMTVGRSGTTVTGVDFPQGTLTKGGNPVAVLAEDADFTGALTKGGSPVAVLDENADFTGDLDHNGAPVVALVAEVADHNTSQVDDVGTGYQTFATLDLGTVTVGQVVDVNAMFLTTALNVAAAVTLYADKSAGTATVVAMDSYTTGLVDKRYFPSGEAALCHVRGVFRVTVTGTLTLIAQAGASVNTTADIGINNGQALARVLSA